jgi:hypothetical protein
MRQGRHETIEAPDALSARASRLSRIPHAGPWHDGLRLPPSKVTYRWAGKGNAFEDYPGTILDTAQLSICGFRDRRIASRSGRRFCTALQKGQYESGKKESRTNQR